MLKNIVRDILIVTGILVMAASTSTSFMQWISDKRNENDAWWGIHKPIQGDLVGMAYLDKVEKFHSLRDYDFEKPLLDSGKVDLYAWGDSYIWKIPDTAYEAVRKYTFGWRYRDDIKYALDTAQHNILLIEIAERYVRPYFSNTDIFNHVYKQEPTTAFVLPATKTNFAALSLPSIGDFFNPYINQNLEYNLFNYNFINPVRQWKASMNYRLFARASGDVVISKNKEQLFLKETVAGKRQENIYHPLDDKELDNIVATINTIYGHYKQEGFDEVYLSVIPNPATILQPEGYNDLIPRLQTHSGLQMKVVDIYHLYKQTNRRIYRPGDTHWNNEGLQLWLKEVNKVLLSWNDR